MSINDNNIDNPNHKKLVDEVKLFCQSRNEIVYEREYIQQIKPFYDITSMINRTVSDLIVLTENTSIEVEIKSCNSNYGFSLEALPLIEQILRNKRYPEYRFAYFCRRTKDDKTYYFNQSKVPIPNQLVIFDEKIYPCKNELEKLSKEIWNNIKINRIEKIPEHGSGDPFLSFKDENMDEILTNKLDKFRNMT